MRLKSLFGLLLLGTLMACEKDETTINPDPAPGTAPDKAVQNYSFNFRYDPAQVNVKEYELILSQKDGEVLLDTLISTRSTHALQVRSGETELDITTIFKNPETGKIYIKSYLQIQPVNWHIDEGFSSIVKGEEGGGRINYTNIPYDSKFIFASKQANGTASSTPNTTDNLRFVNYNRLLPTDLVYILLLNHEKYMFTEVSSAITDVDFSGAETALKKKYTTPANITKYRSFLYGYDKAGDYSKRLFLYTSDIQPSDDYDVLYPSTVIEEFELNSFYTDAQGFRHAYSYLGAALPEEIGFAAEADFKVNKSEVNDFQAEFGEDKPSSLLTYWTANQASLEAYWYIYASPEETAYKPQDFLDKLKAQTLAGKNTSAFSLSIVQSQKAEGFSYQALRAYYANPDALRRKELKQSRLIQKDF